MSGENRCNCGRPISNNKRECSQCAQGKPITMKPYIIVELRQNDVDLLFRAEDGRQLGQRKGGVVHHSEFFPHQNCAAFLSRGHCLVFLKEQARLDWIAKGGNAEEWAGEEAFEIRDGESKIIGAGDGHGLRLNTALTQ